MLNLVKCITFSVYYNLFVCKQLFDIRHYRHCFFFHPSKLLLLEKIVSSVLMTVGYTLYVRVNPYGKDMFYQLSLYVWEENIGLSCIVLDFVKNLNIQHPEAFSYSNP